MNQANTSMTVKTTQAATIIYKTDTLSTVKNKVIIPLERSLRAVTLNTVSDSTEGVVTINAHNSFAYYYNIINLGIGMLVDRNSPKRYGYPLEIKINPADSTTRIYSAIKPTKKGNLFVHVSLPYVNNFYFKPDAGSKHSTGFMGISGGLDYYYRNERYVNLSVSTMMDFFIPFPVPVDYDGGQYDFLSTNCLSLSNNRRIKRFTYGYGLSYVRNNWRFRDYDNHENDLEESYNAFGLVFPMYYQLGKSFHIGMIYRPTFYRPGLEKNFNYEHTISIDLAWKIKVKN